MKRLICVLTIISILVIIGLYKFGIVLYSYSGETSGRFIVTIKRELIEKKYKNEYIVEINKQKLILFVNKNEKTFQTGDIVEINAKFLKPETQRNENGFDYNLYLKTKGVCGILKVESIKKVGKSNNFKIKIELFFSKIRNKIKNILNQKLKKQNASLLIGLLIGEKSEISDETIEDFRNASLSHILAISGAHFSYIVLMLNFANKKIKKKRFGYIFSILSILFFMKLTGASPSILRAGMMYILVSISKLLYRRNDFWTSISLSLLVQIILNPYVIFDIGLILSYTGVIGIVVLYKYVKKIFKSKILSVTVSANIAVTPIIIYNFNTISLSFLFSNIVASILLGPIIILGFVSIIFHFDFIYLMLDLLLTILLKTAHFFAGWGISKIYVTTPNIVSIIIFYLLVIFIIYHIKLKENFKSIKMSTLQGFTLRNFKIIISILITLMIVSNLNFQLISSSIKGEMIVNFIDVGQGDSTLIRTLNKSIMIDSGGSMDEDIDTGKTTILPYLLSKKVTALDYIIISHFDADHCEGFMYVLKNMKVSNAIICKQGENSALYKEFLEICKMRNINIIYVKNGDNIRIGDIKIEILHPSNSFIKNNILNNNAIVCRLIYYNTSILFTGDIEKEAENRILQEDLNIKADILKVAHHGSKTSTQENFLKKVSPKIALIGVGINNRFGHPSAETIEKLKKKDIKIYRTDLNGEITLFINKSGKIKARKKIDNI